MVGSNLKVMRSNQSVVGGDRLTYSGEGDLLSGFAGWWGELLLLKRGAFGELEGRFWVKGRRFGYHSGSRWSWRV